MALNCVANGHLLRAGDFDDLWIQPAAGDAGGALGAALFVWYQLLENPAGLQGHDAQQGSFLGPGLRPRADRSVRVAGKAQLYNISLMKLELLDHVAGLLADGKVVGWFQGRMEFGPRALAHGAFWAIPARRPCRATMNLKIKFRESFRPFAPGVLKERAAEWFDMRSQARESVHVAGRGRARAPARCRGCRRKKTMQHDPDLRHRVNVVRSEIPAVTHVDYQRRLQTVDEERNPRLYRLLDGVQSTDGMPGTDQHELQRAGRADRVHARRRLPLFPGYRHGRARNGRYRDRQRRHHP